MDYGGPGAHEGKRGPSAYGEALRRGTLRALRERAYPQYGSVFSKCFLMWSSLIFKPSPGAFGM